MINLKNTSSRSLIEERIQSYSTSRLKRCIILMELPLNVNKEAIISQFNKLGMIVQEVQMIFSQALVFGSCVVEFKKSKFVQKAIKFVSKKKSIFGHDFSILVQSAIDFSSKASVMMKYGKVGKIPLSLESLLKDKQTRLIFLQFLKDNQIDRLLLFHEQVETFKNTNELFSEYELFKRFDYIIERFIRKNSPDEIPLSESESKPLIDLYENLSQCETLDEKKQVFLNYADDLTTSFYTNTATSMSASNLNGTMDTVSDLDSVKSSGSFKGVDRVRNSIESSSSLNNENSKAHPLHRVMKSESKLDLNSENTDKSETEENDEIFSFERFSMFTFDSIDSLVYGELLQEWFPRFLNKYSKNIDHSSNELLKDEKSKKDEQTEKEYEILSSLTTKTTFSFDLQRSMNQQYITMNDLYFLLFINENQLGWSMIQCKDNCYTSMSINESKYGIQGLDTAYILKWSIVFDDVDFESLMKIFLLPSSCEKAEPRFRKTFIDTFGTFESEQEEMENRIPNSLFYSLYTFKTGQQIDTFSIKSVIPFTNANGEVVSYVAPFKQCKTHDDERAKKFDGKHTRFFGLGCSFFEKMTNNRTRFTQLTYVEFGEKNLKVVKDIARTRLDDFHVALKEESDKKQTNLVKTEQDKQFMGLLEMNKKYSYLNF